MSQVRWNDEKVLEVAEDYSTHTAWTVVNSESNKSGYSWSKRFDIVPKVGDLVSVKTIDHKIKGIKLNGKTVWEK